MKKPGTRFLGTFIIFAGWCRHQPRQPAVVGVLTYHGLKMPATIINVPRFLSIFFFAAILNILSISIKAQDSSHLRISLLTCTPGEELYSTFGHSALRVVDSSSVTDIVFNYGTFNFDDEDFYLKFIRGRLMYYLSAQNFRDFKFDYQSENRGITEQVIQLCAEEKINLQAAILQNIKEENKYYKYDFFLDNCTTRLRDIILKYKKNPPSLPAVMPENTRFRKAIHDYLDKNHNHWSRLGIDILLGLPTDAVMTTSQSQFLPDVLMNAFDSSNHQEQWISPKTNLYSFENQHANPAYFTPLAVFSLLSIFILSISFSKNKWLVGFLIGFDGILFFLSGILGIILILMWTATDHPMCKNNFNLLWALPTNSILSFLVNSNNKKVKKYFGITAAILLIFFCSWFFLPQQMNNALLPVLLLLIFRSGKKYYS